MDSTSTQLTDQVGYVNPDQTGSKGQPKPRITGLASVSVGCRVRNCQRSKTHVAMRKSEVQAVDSNFQVLKDTFEVLVLIFQYQQSVSNVKL